MADEGPVRPLIPASAAPWAEEDMDDWLLARESAAEAASARDLCLMLRWHRAVLAERVMVVDEEERRMQYQQYYDALGRAQEALIAYYEISPALAEDDARPQGAPPTCADPDWPGSLLQADLLVRTTVLEQERRARVLQRPSTASGIRPRWLARLLERGRQGRIP